MLLNLREPMLETRRLQTMLRPSSKHSTFPSLPPNHLNRLMLRSLAEDGEFARLLLGRLSSCWVPKVEECVRAAVAAGDAVAGPVRPNLGGWFTHHLACMVTFCRLPDDPVVDYKAGRDRLVEQTVWFALRGLGLKDEAIRRHYNPKALALFAD